MLKDIATLIEALTKAAWPILAFVLIWRFHDEVGAILQRVAEFKKGKLFGQEVEMEDSLNRLQMTAQAVEEKVAAIPPEQGVIESTEPTTSETDKYLIEAARSPRAALIMLAADIEREARVVLARTGRLNNRTQVPLDVALKEISTAIAGGLSADVLGLLGQFRSVRNSIVHGQTDATDNDVLRAIDSGITLLNVLRSFPSEKHTVKHSYLHMYTDPACTTASQEVGGLMLESEEPGTGRKFERIFPTTRHSYVKGQQLSWEWNPNQVFARHWFIHPDTSKPILGWEASMEFVGRPLDQI